MARSKLVSLTLTLLTSSAVASGTTCATVKQVYKDNQCCAGSAMKEVKGLGWKPMEGPMNSVFPGMDKPKIIVGMDVDYPPYAYLKKEPYSSSTDLDHVVGVGADMMNGMAKHCKFDAHIVQAHWKNCWGSNEIGPGLLQGWYHGCMTYTHAAGVRNRYMEFTNSWARKNKPAGLIVKLTNGKPAFNGDDTLNGKTIVDVTGWAPTAETLYFVKNQCTDKPYKGFTIIGSDKVVLSNVSAAKSKGPNDKALLAVLDGKAHAMFVYGDQAANYHCKAGVKQEGWNCDLWNKFGTDFAYIQSGMFAWMHNGTTVAMSKKGSGLAPFLDKCLASFMKTKEFYEVCKTNHNNHSQINSCISNDFFKGDPHFKPVTVAGAMTGESIAKAPYMFATKEHKTGCSTGYCPCAAR